jgi:hypothetical protein
MNVTATIEVRTIAMMKKISISNMFEWDFRQNPAV